MSYIWSALGDSWYVVAALLLMLVAIIAVDIHVGRNQTPVVDDDTQSQRDAKLFIQVEEYRRDFS